MTQTVITISYMTHKTNNTKLKITHLKILRTNYDDMKMTSFIHVIETIFTVNDPRVTSSAGGSVGAVYGSQVAGHQSEEIRGLRKRVVPDGEVPSVR